MKKPNLMMLLGAIGCFAGTLALYWLSRAEYIETRVTSWNLWQGAGISLLLLAFSFGASRSKKPTNS